MNKRDYIVPIATTTGLALAIVSSLARLAGFENANLPRIDSPSLFFYTLISIALILAWRNRRGVEPLIRLAIEVPLLGICLVAIIYSGGKTPLLTADFFTGFGKLDATLLAFLSGALLIDHMQNGIGRGLSRSAASVVIIVCITNWIVRAYNVPAVYFLDTGLVSFSTLQAITLLLFATAIIMLHPDKGLPSLLVDSTLPAVQLRTLLPAVLILPLLTGLIVVQLTPALNTAAMVALTALGSAILAALVVMASTANLSVAENALYVREQALRATSTPIFLINNQQPGKPIVWINDAFTRVTGYPGSEVIGQNFPFLRFDSNDQNEQLQEVRRAMDAGQMCTVILHTEREDGSFFWNRLSVSPVSTRSDIVSHFVCFIVDITEDRAREERLQRYNLQANGAMNARDTFVSYIEHELRTPLNAAQTWVDLMKLNPTPETLEKGLEVLAQSVRTQTKLITDLSDIARVTEGTLALDLENIDLHHSLNTLCNELLPEFGQDNLSFEVDLGQDPVWMVADEVRIQQVIRNLLTNARRYNKDGGTVWLKLETHADGAKIIVADSGIGISKAYAARIFEPYWRANQHRKGLGIGLSLAAAIIEAHEGTLEVASEGEGHGSTFTVQLPYRLSDKEKTVEMRLVTPLEDASD